MVTKEVLKHIRENIYKLKNGVANGSIIYALAIRQIDRLEKIANSNTPIMGIEKHTDYTDQAMQEIDEAYFWIEDYFLGKEQAKCMYVSKPQQEKPNPTRPKGRPKETLKDKMIDDADGSKLQKIHTKIVGKKGKDAALIILAGIEKGWMLRPTHTQVKNEFGDIGSKQGYNRYLNKDKFTKEELEGAKNSLN